MVICHVCQNICGDEEEFCPKCGAQLNREPESETEASAVLTIENPVLAASVEDVVTAEIFRDVLQENGIPFSCDSDAENGSMKVLFGGGFIAEDIYVDERNLEKAQQLYEEILSSEPEMAWDEESEEESDGETDAE